MAPGPGASVVDPDPAAAEEAGGNRASPAPRVPVELHGDRWSLLLLHIHRRPPWLGLRLGHRWWRLLALQGGPVEHLGEAVPSTHLVLDDSVLVLLDEPCVPVGTVHGERQVVDEVLRELGPARLDLSLPSTATRRDGRHRNPFRIQVPMVRQMDVAPGHWDGIVPVPLVTACRDIGGARCAVDSPPVEPTRTGSPPHGDVASTRRWPRRCASPLEGRHCGWG